MEKDFMYEPLPGERWVRVLILEPSLDTSQHLHATLGPSNIGESLPAVPRDGDTDYKDREADYHREWDARKLDYHALAYSWAMQNGDASLSHSMILAGKVVNITQILAEGLLNIRSTTEPTRLWIDAICIDQKNMAERGSQVAMMFDIYRMAVGVIIWLENGATETEDFKIWQLLHSLAIRGVLDCDRWHVLEPVHKQVWMTAWDALLYAADSEVRALQSCLCLSNASLNERTSARPTVKTRGNRATFGQWCGPDKDKADALATSIRPIMPLLRRRYWSRRWVLQEDLARDSHSGAGLYRWGRYSVGAGIMRKLFDLLQYIDGPRDEAEHSRGARDMTQDLRDFFSELKTRERALYNTVYPSGGSMDLCRLLQRNSALQCSDPRDCLYALIALDPSCGVQVDYDSSFRDVCIDLATKMVQKGDFRVLDVARYTQLDSSDLSLELPSWVPSLHASWGARIPLQEGCTMFNRAAASAYRPLHVA
ncbi:Putative heterokaryon incompatibility [Septoria linicola]|uniref:Heterokaryon incompatibility n=1 Tax=Septoria linicola TaxID=215465 RepID=A0A9Q9EHB6_9PEZI|nr:putative heterokaryon incompatibility [Septoria linicola]USW50835.1 Putative heterokaryon incompatibility [Septoria linicola]